MYYYYYLPIMTLDPLLISSCCCCCRRVLCRTSYNHMLVLASLAVDWSTYGGATAPVTRAPVGECDTSLPVDEVCKDLCDSKCKVKGCEPSATCPNVPCAAHRLGTLMCV